MARRADRASARRSLTLTPRDDLAMIAVQGPNARAKVWQALPGSEAASARAEAVHGALGDDADGELFVARTGYTGEDGFEIMVPAARAEATVARARRGRRRSPAAWARATRCASKPA